MAKPTQTRLLIGATFLAVCGLAVPSDASNAQGAPPAPSAEVGLKLSETLCQTCHLISDAVPGKAVTVGIPSFRGIANKPGQTGKAIELVLIKPHLPMPDMKLTNAEIQDIIAYLDSLRTDKSGPTLLLPSQPPEKTKYPAPT
jgi:cytochrome c